MSGGSFFCWTAIKATTCCLSANHLLLFLPHKSFSFNGFWCDERSTGAVLFVSCQKESESDLKGLNHICIYLWKECATWSALSHVVMFGQVFFYPSDIFCVVVYCFLKSLIFFFNILILFCWRLLSFSTECILFCSLIGVMTDEPDWELSTKILQVTTCRRLLNTTNRGSDISRKLVGTEQVSHNLSFMEELNKVSLIESIKPQRDCNYQFSLFFMQKSK